MTDLNKAIIAIEKTTKGLQSAAATAEASLKVANEILPALLEEIADKQVELDTLKETSDVAVRRSAVELELRVLENEDKVLTELMEARGLATIKVGELETLEAQLAGQEEAAKHEMAKAVNAAVAKVKAEAEAAASKADADHKVEVATLKANNQAQEERISFLNDALESARGDVAAERKARVDIANAESQRQGVVVNTTAK